MKIEALTKRPVIAIVHGVNTPHGEPWADDFAWLQHGIGATLVKVKWPSKSFMGDGIRWQMSRRYREHVMHHIGAALYGVKPDLVVTHSFGQVVTNAFWAKHGLPGCPVVNIAGPLTNPGLRLLHGRWSPPPGLRPTVILNRDDQITSLFGSWRPVSQAREHVVVDVDIAGDEHPVQHYLEHPTVQNVIRAELLRGLHR